MFDFLSPERCVTLVLAIVAGIAVAKALYRVDDRIEKRRAAAAKTAGVLEGLGLELVPAMLQKYSIGDYDGFFNDLHHLAEILQNPAKVAELIAGVFYKQVPTRLAAEEDRLKLLKAVVEWAKAHPDQMDAARVSISAS